MNSLEVRWESDHTSFTQLSKVEFDWLCRGKQFIEGPVVSGPSAWMKEFGPYTPERWAFGRLINGRLVRCNVTVNEAGND